MSSPGGSNKRRSLGNQLSVEEQALNIIAKEADTREEKSSAFLAEARKLRSSEREKSRKEEQTEEDDDSNVPSKHATSIPRPTASNKIPLEHLNSRDMPMDMQENFKKLMMANVQLDNEKQAVAYEVELLKDLLSDKLEEFLEMKGRLQKIIQERGRLTLDLKEARERCDKLMVAVTQRDHLIKSNGFSLVTLESLSLPDAQYLDSKDNAEAAILTADHLDMLADYTGSLGDRLKQLFEDKLSALTENKRLNKEIDSLKSDQSQNANQMPSPLLSPSLDETHKQYTETKLKLKRAEQEITTLHGTVTRLETQMLRYKTSAENLEKTEEELKAEKRKLQIELREAKTRIEDLEAKNNIYVKRIEKLKSKNLLESN